MNGKISRKESDRINELVAHYQENLEQFERFMGYVQSLFGNAEALVPYVHSKKWRVKDPEHLKDKLARRVKKSKTSFKVTKDNLFKEVTDLVGYRILHLHTTQIRKINEIILALLKQENYVLIEGPIASTWDSESTTYFKSIGIKTRDTGRMYTSVHYLFKTNKRALPTCELQVRTLAEEIWGEVDHMINYPHPSPISACREQISVLARLTSSCSRLVDSIFQSNSESSVHPTVRGRRTRGHFSRPANGNRPIPNRRANRKI